jgi:hypothetical protein
VYGQLLDRSRPLWELWFLTGLEDGRLGIMLKVHHAVADGSAAVRIMGSLFDLEAAAPDPPPEPWTPRPLPGGWALFVDNLAGRLRTLRAWAALVAHPGRLLRALRVFKQVAKKSFGATKAPTTSLNRPVLAGRRIRFMRTDLDAMKRIAHAHGGKVNDVVLALWAGGLRDLMVSRGEPVEGVELNAGQAVSIREKADATIDNQVGTVVVPLPVWEPESSAAWTGSSRSPPASRPASSRPPSWAPWSASPPPRSVAGSCFTSGPPTWWSPTSPPPGARIRAGVTHPRHLSNHRPGRERGTGLVRVLICRADDSRGHGRRHRVPRPGCPHGRHGA